MVTFSDSELVVGCLSPYRTPFRGYLLPVLTILGESSEVPHANIIFNIATKTSAHCPVKYEKLREGPVFFKVRIRRGNQKKKKPAARLA
jgi:hypothetical protein